MSGMWLGKGDANHGRERGRARARGSKRKLGVMSWGKGLKNIGLEGRRNEEEEEVKRREVAVLKRARERRSMTDDEERRVNPLNQVLIQLVPVVETAAADFTEVQFTLFINLELDDCPFFLDMA